MNQSAGLLHPGGFNMMTETGRFSAQDPNVQAMPKRGPVRQMIVAPPGEAIVSIDFSNIEPRVLGQALSQFIKEKDERLLQLKKENRERAGSVFGELLKQRRFVKPFKEQEQLPLPTSSALAECFADKDGDPYVLVAKRMYGLNTIDKALRDKSKGVLLATMYGQSLPGYAARMECSYDDAADMLNRLSGALPEIGVPTYIKKAGQWVKAKPTLYTYREHVESMIRLGGEVTSLFGRKRRFAGLYQLRNAERATIIYEWRKRYYEWDVAPIQLWNFALHCYVYSVRDQKTGTVLATSSTTKSPYSIMHRPGLCYWPFRQLSYKFIRSVIIDGQIIEFQPIEDCHRQGFNAIIQMSAGDIFKKAMLAVDPVAREYGGRMFLSVHDELVFLIPKPRLHQFVRHAVDVMERYPADWWQIPIKVEVKVGPNYDLKDTPAYVSPRPWWMRVWQWLRRVTTSKLLAYARVIK
jgi:DNA polymerase I-like protein with 3'-5' exonuclease and polymerase domains